MMSFILWIVIGTIIFIALCSSCKPTEKTPEQLAQDQEANRALWLYENDREAWEREFPPQPKDDPNVRIQATIRCPHCGFTDYTIMQRGWKATTGFLGSSKPVRVCNRCMKKF